jgi:nucleotide-binding universal stress UspA family protein
MTPTVLVAVNDSAAAFAAARTAIALARRGGDALHALAVVDDADGSSAVKREEHVALERSADAVLRQVAALAQAADVPVTTRRRSGPATSTILDEAGRVGAEILVVGLVDKPSHAMPAIGTHTLQLLEFADIPVLVVPSRPS